MDSIHHINSLRKESQVIMSIDAEKALGQIQPCSLTETRSKLRTEVSFLPHERHL